jgi:lipopolysaccharide export system permease protein
MDRWLLQELVGPLLFGIAAFTAVSLSVGVVFELVRRVAESGLPPQVAVQVLLLRLPGFLVLAFPMATLMATLLAYSRLSGSSELTALRSVGVGTTRMVIPALALALAMSLLTFVSMISLCPGPISSLPKPWSEPWVRPLRIKAAITYSIHASAVLKMKIMGIR